MQEASGDVVVEVGEAEGDAAQVFEPAVDGLGGPVAGELVVEEGQDVRQAAFEGAGQGPQLAGRVGGAACAAEELEPLLEIPEEKRRFPLIVTGGVFLLTGILSLHLRILAGGIVLYLLALLIGRIQRNAIVRRTGRASLRIFETDGYAAETILLLAGMAVA